ncbi:hypothetical protein ONS95_014205 [Cadophora gregata]|uniref:uncharacterized protein n=1 Tax=Cadophora gregata TaxID=51156 RepID=UPI0026DC4C02|nr:uncharacterized protein ONS95_014205 [Cadophora gregata]KAK0113960.1 hypothetical protein ONS96_014809 [Cadophora gregata f. sp. sojae]KAK0114721.1 hypothetical protein ONS95_014205 [Cadophora gregata]
MVVSAANKSYAQALRFLRPRGTLVCIGMQEGEQVPIGTEFPARITNQQFRIVGSAIGNRREAIEALDFAARGLVRYRIRIEKLENLSKVFEDMHAGKLQARVVVALP